MPQSTTLVPFRVPTPAISHFDVLGFNSDTLKTYQKFLRLL